MKKFFLLAFAGLLAQGAAHAQMQPAPGGVQYQVFTQNNPNPKIKYDDIVTLNLIQRTEKDSVMFSSYKIGHTVQVRVQISQNPADLMDIFPKLALKDSALIVVPVDTIFKGHETERPAYLPAHSHIFFTVKVEKVQTLNEAIAERNAAIAKAQQDEAIAADKYIATNKLDMKTTASGLKYMLTSEPAKGSTPGRRPLPGDTLIVNYVGRTLDGRVFDTSVPLIANESGLAQKQPGREYQPIKIVIGQGQVIPGWDEGLLLIGEGGAEKLIIPSKLAYGAQGAGSDIPPFSTLVFDINLIKVFPAKHAAPAPAKKPVAKKTTTTAKKTTTTKSH